MKKILVFICCLVCAGLMGIASVNAEQVKDEQYYLNLGKDYEWKNNRLGAIDLYTKALEVNPNLMKPEAREQDFCILKVNMIKRLRIIHIFITNSLNTVPVYIMNTV